MSIAVQIICDGCGKTVSCGKGKGREPAHVVRNRLIGGGWRINGDPEDDLCESCRPPKRTSRENILNAGSSPPFIQVGMVLRPTGAAGATIPSAGDGDFNDGPRTVVAVEKTFGEPASAKLVPGYQNSATLQERCAQLEEDRFRLMNLLAVINRDGGHHAGRVGIQQAVDDALAEFHRLRGLAGEFGYE